MRTEFLKLRTTRSPLVLLVAAQLVIVAGVSGLFLSGNGDIADPVTAQRAIAHAGLVSIFSLILGILAVAGEYRHGTITDTYLSFPGRGRLVTAKLAAYGLIGAAAGLISALAALAVTAAWWSAKGGAFGLSAAASWQTLGGGVAANIAFAAVGVGLGALVRNLAGAVAAALAWIALVEGIAGQLLGPGLARWLPFSASEALDRANLTSASGLLPQWGGGLVVLCYAAAFSAAAVITTLKRDVT